nr:hypothetical protein [Synechococcus sp. GEYO]
MASADLVMAAEAPLIQDREKQGKDWVRIAHLRPGRISFSNPLADSRLDQQVHRPVGSAV